MCRDGINGDKLFCRTILAIKGDKRLCPLSLPAVIGFLDGVAIKGLPVLAVQALAGLTGRTDPEIG